ncbi:MAG: NAD-dependent epimerase/dehydratase family protein [Thermoanaerobaculia bacterium]|nr:NAD-dependent epimerase/dehydratase family protein [Thermoanaerobaculia bacterium]
MSATARYLITGASGGLGRALAARLPREDVTAVGRVEPTPDLAGRFVPGDVTTFAWKGILGAETVVFHLAAVVHRRPRGDAEVRQTYEVNTEATARLAEAARGAGAKLVFASTVAVFGGEGGAIPVNEDTPPRPATDYAKSKLLAEEAIRAEENRGLGYAILRFPLLYGPWGRGNMERMLRAIGRRAYLPLGNQSTPKSTLYFDDAAAALLLAAREPAARCGTYIASPRVAPTLGQIHAAAYRATGRWNPPALPAPVARLAGRAADRAMGLMGRQARFAEQVRTLTAPAHFDGSRFAAATGFEARVPLEEGMARTAAWLREKGSP